MKGLRFKVVSFLEFWENPTRGLPVFPVFLPKPGEHHLLFGAAAQQVEGDEYDQAGRTGKPVLDEQYLRQAQINSLKYIGWRMNR